MIRRRKTLKICLAASSGGHISQLLKLAERGAWEGRRAFYVTTKAIVMEKLQKYGKVYVVGECNREHPVQVVKVLMRCVKIVLQERPNVVISTGAAVGCMVCLLGKLFGAKIVWIDSITNTERISLSGRMVRHIANLFLVQWPELADRYKKIEYAGTAI